MMIHLILTFNLVTLAYLSILLVVRINSCAIDLQSDSDISDENEAYDNEHPLEATDYKRLIAIHAGKPKGGLKDVLKVEPDKVRRLSLSEQTLEKAAESHVTELVRYA